MRPSRLPVLAAALAVPAAAQGAELAVGVEIPRLSVAEYHRPYVALWIETPDQAAVKTLAVWYDVRAKNDKGANWLKDLRQWWRRAGRSQSLADGIAGPTRAPGRHQLTFAAAAIGDLAPGSYNLVVEAAREVGGREVVRTPFAWPAGGRGGSVSARGAEELGEITVAVRP
ncbi:MAG: DUF2271 domain-containing protein [Phenylobacterium sp.]|uniref:DUF2271 domain-containing protein n=1 Tax=Phenylobacterium sp. TaxID=1871053 RepID=UPI00391945BA